MATLMAIDKTGNLVTQTECSTLFISCTLHSLALRLGPGKAIPTTKRQLALVATLRPQIVFCLVDFDWWFLPFLHFYEYLGSMCVRNVCTSTVSEPGDMLCRVTGHFIGTAAELQNINIYVNN